MTSTGRNKMLVILVGVLLLTNVAMLYYLVRDYKEDKKSRSEKQVDFVKKELHLDDTQLNQYLGLRVTRDSIMKPMNDALRAAKMKMVGYLKLPSSAVPDSLVANTAAEITSHQKDIEVAYYHHFRRMQTICRPDQLHLLDSILVQMVNRTTKKSDDKQRKN